MIRSLGHKSFNHSADRIDCVIQFEFDEFGCKRIGSSLSNLSTEQISLFAFHLSCLHPPFLTLESRVSTRLCSARRLLLLLQLWPLELARLQFQLMMTQSKTQQKGQSSSIISHWRHPFGLDSDSTSSKARESFLSTLDAKIGFCIFSKTSHKESIGSIS